MFWRFGGYANISTLDSILDKPDVTLEEILDETDLIQELKQHNTKLIEYLRDEKILRRLFQYVLAHPIQIPEEDEEDEDEEPAKKGFSGMRSISLSRTKDAKTRKHEELEELNEAEKSRQKYAFAACEILSSETWSIMEAILEARDILKDFWSFLENPAPVDPVTAGYFSKIAEPLLDKKTGDMLEFVRSYTEFVPTVLKHIDTPNIMDVLLKMISLEKSEGGAGIIEWLHDQDLMPRLLQFVGPGHATSTQIAAGDFIKAIVTISANASQNEQQCIGPNSLTRQLVSEPCIRELIANMMSGGNPLTVGVGIIIEVIRKNNSDYDPEVGGGPDAPPSSSDPIYLGTLLRLFADIVPDFTALLTSPKYTLKSHESSGGKQGRALKAAFGKTIEPLGFDRFKTCELMAELLHCSNMGLLNEPDSEALIKQKDLERERLRREGKLSRTRSSASSNGDDRQYGDLSSETYNGDQSRKLEVTNSADDDGFEELGTSAELEGQMDDKDTATIDDEKREVQLIKPSKSRLSLDDEFFDEPLTSPKLQATEGESRAAELTDEVIGRQTEAESNLLAEKEHAESDLSEKTTSEQLVDAIESQLGPGTLEAEPPALPERQAQLAVRNSSTSESRDISPHPEDKPAPLFSGKTNTGPGLDNKPEQTASQNDLMDQDTTTENAEPEGAHQENPATAPTVHVEQEMAGKQLVGDYLKMQFVEYKVIPTILDFFFRFPWNNFLHNVVYDVVQQVFNGPMDRGHNRLLAIDLFDTGHITDRIIEGQLRSDEAQRQNNMRLGYMGHLTLIAEEVAKFSERQPPELLSDCANQKLNSAIWTDYVDNTLAETRERDNAILGGVRPDAVGGPRQAVLNAVNSGSFSSGGSSTLANAGLSGGNDIGDNNHGGGANFVSGGSLLSGFGSSSDEEDDEMEEIGEHEEGGVRNEQHYAYTPSSLAALSIFSPPKDINAAEGDGSEEYSSSDKPGIPPPLNIPPSRARRRFAARLAGRNHNSGEQETNVSGTSDDSATSLSAAFSGTIHDQDDSDPWATVNKPSNGTAGHMQDESSDWVDAAQQPSRMDLADFDNDIEHSKGSDDDDDDEEEGEDVPIRLSFGDGDDRERHIGGGAQEVQRDKGAGSDSTDDVEEGGKVEHGDEWTKPKEASARSVID